MQIQERTVGEITVLGAQGQMTGSDGYGAVQRRVRELVLEGHVKLVIDLNQVPYMDSTCVGELVSAFITVRSRGGTVKFAGVSSRIAELFTIAKLHTVFEVFVSHLR